MKLKMIVMLCIAWCMAFSQTNVDTFIENYMTAHHLPGISACVIKDGKVAWAKAYGLADVANNKPVTLNTIFMLASVSKTITGDALMNEWERGAFQLDDSINSILPWSVRNPNFPNVPITVRQLLTHTSSINDNWNIFDAYQVYGDSPYLLGDFMHDYLVPGSINYDSLQNFYNYSPGDSANYCNAAVALCGYLVKRLSNVSFNQYCIDSIFTPLCMDNTSWMLSGIADTTMVARPYLYNNGAYEDQNLYGFPDFPDGQLRTTALSLAKFLLMNMQYGRFDNVRILDSSTVVNMRTAQYPLLDNGQGLIWYKYDWNGRVIWGHSGGYDGCGSEMWMDSAKNEGVIILCNRDADTFDPILNQLFLMADTITTTDKPALTCDFHTGMIETEISKSEWSVYPNPFNASATVQFGQALKNDEVYIYNLYGHCVRVIKQVSGKTLTIEKNNLPNGVYFISVPKYSSIACKMVITD